MTPSEPPKKGTGPICQNGPEGAAHKLDLSPFSPTPEFEELLTALCDDSLSPQQARRLEEIVIADDAACWHYLCHVHLHGALHWNIGHAEGHSSPFILAPADLPSPAVGAAVELPHQPAPDFRAPEPAPLIPPIIIHDFSPAEAPLFSALFAPGGWPFSYAAATVLTGMILLVFWVWTVSHEREVAESTPPAVRPVQKSPQPEAQLVGRITGLFDCRWSGPENAPADAAAVPVGRAYHLVSGLMEITYQSGAKVILQGPCAYEVDSLASGFLSLGKLTARVESARPQATNPKFQIPNPRFVVKTPTAVVTDLGTEFGVEVDPSGATESHVFRGKVEVRGSGDGHGGRAIQLEANQSARVEIGDDRRVKVVREASQAVR